MHRARFAITPTVAAALGSLLLAAGCSAGAGQNVAPASGQPQGWARPASHPLARGPGWLAPAAKSCKEKLYVSSYHLNYVSIYCTKGHNQAPIGQITDGITSPEGANTDRRGNLYVTNTNANTVTEYAPGETTPSFTYSKGLTAPAGVAVDGKQNVYVSSISPASIQVFPQNVNTPTLTITNVPFPIDLALDAAANLYVTSYTPNFANGEVIKYSPGSSKGTSLGIVTDGPGGITLDKAGDIVTADQKLPGVLVFPPGATKPSKTFAQNTIDPDPVRFLRSEQRVYVGDAIGNAVYVYAYPSGALVDTITDGIDGPNGLALDPPAPL